MAGSQSCFEDSVPVSNSIDHLIQNRLSRLQRTNTPQDLTTTIETLSSFIRASESVLKCVGIHVKEVKLQTVMDWVQNVLCWNDFLDSVETIPSDTDFLFRAHQHDGTGTGAPTFSPDYNIPFNFDYRCISSIDTFAIELNYHLGKTQRGKAEGVKIMTSFVSMSPILEWTIHTTGQKRNGRHQTVDENTGLAIFHADKLRKTSDTTIFRVSSVLDFLASQGKGDLIEQELQVWARNCDEYVAMGRIPDDCLVRWVQSKEIVTLPIFGFPNDFTTAYTLGVYRMRRSSKRIELDLLCQNVIDSAKVLVGAQHDLLSLIVNLLLRPGVQFWGLNVSSIEEDIVTAKIQALVEEMALPRLSTLEI